MVRLAETFSFIGDPELFLVVYRGNWNLVCLCPNIDTSLFKGISKITCKCGGSLPA